MRSRSATGWSPSTIAFSAVLGRRAGAARHARRAPRRRRPASPVVSNVDVALLVMGARRRLQPAAAGALPRARAGRRHRARGRADQDRRAVPADESLETRLAELRDRIPPHVDVVAVNATDAMAADALRDYLERGPNARDAGLVGRRQVDADQHAPGCARAGHGRRSRARRPRQAHDDVALAAPLAWRRLRHRHARACARCVPTATRRRSPTASPTSASLAARCRFRDCRHDAEPGCAVREGVDGDRLRNYHKLLREVRRDTLTALDRQKEVAVWKARGKATAERMKQKRG